MTDSKRPIGRPPIYGTPATEKIVVRVTPAQYGEVRRVAAATGTTTSSIVRELIDERLEDGRPFPIARSDRESQ